MTKESFERWLQAYGQAWETRDPAAVAALFTEDARYYETPFTESMRGRAAIHEYWSHVPRSQDRIQFRYQILAVLGDVGIARWWASFVRLPSEIHVKLDGIFVVAFDGNSLCRELREWWHREEKQPD